MRLLLTPYFRLKATPPRALSWGTYSLRIRLTCCAMSLAFPLCSPLARLPLLRPDIMLALPPPRMTTPPVFIAASPYAKYFWNVWHDLDVLYPPHDAHYSNSPADGLFGLDQEKIDGIHAKDRSEECGYICHQATTPRLAFLRLWKKAAVGQLMLHCKPHAPALLWKNFLDCGAFLRK